MEIFKQLEKLGYKHYVDLTIEELDALPIDDIEKIIEYSLIIDWLRDNYNLDVIISSNLLGYGFIIYQRYPPKNVSDNRVFQHYHEAREQAILKAIEIINGRSI